MIAGARVDVAPYKQNPADFVLWKPSKPGEPVWESPWGPGRPGWHIECSAMIEQTLGLPIDIHGGGIDLVFPHHENERAQGVCATHEPTYSAFWLHNGFLNFGEEKMSKSLGNVALAHDLLKAFPGEAIRWALLVGHYRAPLEWNGELIEQAKRSLDRLYGALRRAAEVAPSTDAPSAAFVAALEDDLNTAAAMAELFALASALETGGADEKARAKGELIASAGLMGFLAADPEQWFQGGVDEAAKARINDLVAARDAARRAKDWPSADRIRAELAALNVEVMDGPAGATWRIKEQA
jgi:cysteinyl-tRNA synthetase